MQRFVLFGLVSLMVAVQYASAINMGRCAQLALAKGVPSIKLPSHDPLHIHRNIDIHMDHILGQKFVMYLGNITWTNIPWWEVRGEKVVKNTTDVIVNQSAFWWNNFTISLKYDFEFGASKQQGDITYLLEDVTWSAEWEETKPDAEGKKKLNYLKVHLEVAKRSVKTNGFGLMTFVAENLLLAAYDILHEVNNLGNLIGVAFGYKINQEWYGNQKHYDALVAWCKDHNVN